MRWFVLAPVLVGLGCAQILGIEDLGDRNECGSDSSCQWTQAVTGPQELTAVAARDGLVVVAGWHTGADTGRDMIVRRLDPGNGMDVWPAEAGVRPEPGPDEATSVSVAADQLIWVSGSGVNDIDMAAREARAWVFPADGSMPVKWGFNLDVIRNPTALGTSSDGFGFIAMTVAESAGAQSDFEINEIYPAGFTGWIEVFGSLNIENEVRAVALDRSDHVYIFGTHGTGMAAVCLNRYGSVYGTLNATAWAEAGPRAVAPVPDMDAVVAVGDLADGSGLWVSLFNWDFSMQSNPPLTASGVRPVGIAPTWDGRMMVLGYRGTADDPTLWLHSYDMSGSAADDWERTVPGVLPTGLAVDLGPDPGVYVVDNTTEGDPWARKYVP